MALSLQTTGQRKPYQRGLGMPQQQPSVFGQAKPLQAPQPLTQAGGLAQQKNLQGLQTGQFGDVQSAQNATNRAGALRQYQAIQSSRANALRGNLSTEQAQRMQDQSLASANSQNLTAQNSVNAMQRQYGQDAINQANAYEKDAYGMATNERGYQDSRNDLGYSRATDEKRYGDSRGDVAFGQNMQTQQFQAGRSDTAFNQGMARDQFGANRQDAAFSQGLARDQFGANRDDALYARGYQQSRDQVGDARYDQSFNYQAGRDAIGDQRYDQSYSDSRADLGYNRGIDESRYADTRGDVQYQRGYQESRDAVGDTRYDQSYADQRSDVKYGQDYQASRDQVGDTRYDAATAYSQSRDAIGDQRYDQSYQDQRGDVQYARGRDTVADQRYDQQYADTRGDVQYQRGYQETRDAVGDTRYNTETAYNQSRDAIGDQRYDATTAYNQSRDAVGDQRYDASTQYQQSRDALADTRYDDMTSYNRTEAQRLEGKGDIESLISSVQDPRAQNLLRNVQAQGGDVQAMYNSMLDNGTIREEYRSASPGTLEAQALTDKLQAIYPNKTPQQIQELAQQQMEGEYKATTAPVTQAAKTADQAAAIERLANGTPKEGDYDLLPSVNVQSIPLGANTNKWLAENQTGGWTNIGGTPYRILSGGNAGGGSTGDYANIQDKNGNPLYLLNNGTISQTKPASPTVSVPNNYFRGMRV